MANAFAMYEQVLSRLGGGGDTLKADLADIEAGKKSAIATGTQNLISGGLGGTTVMGAVPLSAEKTAARARLRARGGAEEKYMSALASFANLAESSKQQELNRGLTANMYNAGAIERRQTTLNNRPTVGGSYGFGADASNRAGWGLGTYGTLGGSSQYPTLYGDGGQLPAAPTLGGSTGGSTGSGSAGGWSPPREYDPSMVGKSMWAQQGSQVPTTLEQGTQQQVMSSLPQSAQGTSKPTFKSTTNYLSMYYNKTGKQLGSQQEAYSALYPG